MLDYKTQGERENRRAGALSKLGAWFNHAWSVLIVMLNRIPWDSTLCKRNTSDFALTTLHVYSMIWNEQMSGGVVRCVPPPIFCVPTSRCSGFPHNPKCDLSGVDLFFLLTSCSHLTAHEPALSKESIESNHVNTPTKSASVHIFVPIFAVYFYINIGTSSADSSRKGWWINILFTFSNVQAANASQRNKGACWFYTPFAPMSL